MEPWGLVVNEAAACGLRCWSPTGPAASRPSSPTRPGRPAGGSTRVDEAAIAAALAWMAGLPEADRAAMGRRAAEVVAGVGPGAVRRGDDRGARGSPSTAARAGGRPPSPARPSTTELAS